MTTAGGMAGGSGFEYGENTVAARLSIDIPTEGVQSLREITQEISRFRTEMEAASRSQGDFIGFFQNLPSISAQAASAFQTYADQLERGIALQQRMSGGLGQWDVQPGSQTDPFRGMTAGTGRSTGDINDTIADMDRMRQMGTVGERQYLNMQMQHGNLGSGDIPMTNSNQDIAAATERIANRERINQQRSGGGIAEEITNEFGAGRGLFSRMGRRGRGEVPHPDGDSGAVGSQEGPGGGGLLGKIGMGLGLAGSAYGAVQFGGSKLQELRAMGLNEGGGIKEGAQQELQARMLAMNPFITNDQARSIIQGALRDGYSGKEYETVTKFMEANLKDFAMSANETREMYKKDVLMGGLTPSEARANLEITKELSSKERGGYLQYDDRRRAEGSLRGLMESAGASGEASTRMARTATEMFSDDPLLVGGGNDMIMNAMSSTEGQGMYLAMAGITPSSDFGEWGEQIAQSGSESMQRVLTRAANMSRGNKGTFKMLLNQMGMNYTQAQANKLLSDLQGGKNHVGEAEGRINDVISDRSGVQQRSGAEQLNAGVGGTISALGGSIADMVTGNFENIPQRFRENTWGSQNEHIPILDQIVQGQGNDPNKIMVQNSSGEWEKLQADNKDQLDALAGGGKWRHADSGGEGQTLQQAAQQVAVHGEVSLHVTSDPGVSVQAPKTFRLTPNQMAANAGWGNATVNNPPPGDR